LALSGYKAVGLTVPTGLMKDQLVILRNYFLDSGLEVFLRADLTCSKREDLLKLLRRFRSAFDIISVKCTNHNIALVAARDRRVDLIFFDSARRNVWFDHSIANVSNATLELNTSTLFATSDHLTLTKLMKDVNTAQQHKVDTIISSGCTSPFLVKAPTQLSAIGMILGLSKGEALNSVSVVPSRIVGKNVERRSRNYIEEGVKVVTRKD
jgi:RNase P/RNase MRP subunit p30